MFFERTKTNRLKLPKSLKKLKDVDVSGLTVNWAGLPVAKVGDAVHFSNGVSAGTVGVITSIKDLGSGGEGFGNSPKVWLAADIKTLAGTTDGMWLWACTVLPDSAVQEVIDFYTEDGRPERIKYNPLHPQ